MRKEFEAGKSFDEKEKLAWENAADAEEAFAAGERYFTPVKPDYERAYLWFTKAAELGSGDAYARLGEMYAEGDITGIGKDLDKALAYFRKAAELGSANGMHLLGRMYRHGWLVEQDYGKALSWYRKAAALGSKHAMYAIGTMYEHGDGVKQNFYEAGDWYDKSLAGVEACEEQARSDYYSDSDDDDDDDDYDDDDDALRNERSSDYGRYSFYPYYEDAKYYADVFYRRGKWDYDECSVHYIYYQDLSDLERAAALYSNKALKLLGDWYFFARGLEDDDLAWDYYMDAEYADNRDAELRLGDMKFFGIGDDLDWEDARKWEYEFEFSDYNDEITAYRVGRMYRYGISTEQDYWQALDWYRRAAYYGSAAVLPEFEELYENASGNEDYAEELSICEEKALAGDNKAMYKLSWMYYFGLGKKADHAEAFKWYKKAAEAGNEKAENCLADMQERNIDKEFGELFARCQKEAAEGCADAYYELGWSYYFGLGTEIDRQKALECLEKAAGKGVTAAARLLAAIYALGRGVNKDYIKALEWYHKAHNEYISGYKGEYSYEDVIDEFCRTMDITGPDEVRKIGDIYAGGDGVEKDELRAAQWYRKAERLEDIYSDGDFACLKRGAFSGNAVAMCNLGHSFRDGHEVAQDYKRAVACYFAATCMNGCTSAAYWLGRMHSCGNGIAQNYTLAREWYLKYLKTAGDGAAMSRQAMYGLARIYREGLGVKADQEKAAEWLRKAEEGLSKEEIESVRKKDEADLQRLSRKDESPDETEAGDADNATDSASSEKLQEHEKKLDGMIQEILEKIDELKNDGPDADKVFREKEKQEWENATNAEEAFAAGERYFTNYSPMIPDYQRAYLWFTKAAELGSGDAWARLGEMYTERNIVCLKLNLNKALACFRKAAELGSANGMHLLGRMYRHGWLVEQDYEKALTWYRKAAGLGSKHAMYALGTMYEQGDGVEQDYDAADRWYMKSLEGFETCLEQAAKGDISLNMDYLSGARYLSDKARKELSSSFATDMRLAISADFGLQQYNPYYLDAKYYADALYRLGRRRLAVDSVASAFDLFVLAGNLYSNKAIKMLGDMYFFGDGVEQDYGEARAFYHDALRADNPEAKLRVAEIEILGLGGEQKDYYALKKCDKGETAYLGGRMCKCGIGTKKDYWRSLPFYRVAVIGGVAGAAAAMSEFEEIYVNEPANTDYAEEFADCEKKALAGDNGAMYKLSWMCYFGIGIKADHAEAFAWYKKAAAAGNEKAKTSLENDTVEITDMDMDNEGKFAIIRKEADEGGSSGYFFLGWCYYFGVGTKRDGQKAAEYMEKAAAKGDFYAFNAMNVLAVIYVLGRGVKQDYIKALEWYIKAHYLYTLGYSGEYGYEDVIDEFCRAMALDDPRKVREIGDLYANGSGVEKDELRAAQWYRKAERLEKLSELNSMGEQYLAGSGVGQDYAKAIYYFRKAGFSGNADGINNLGNMYAEGLGVEQDYKRAMAFYFIAANMNGHAEAAYSLGRLYGYGLGVAQDYMRAREWYLKAAGSGQREAMLELAKIYREGLGVKKDQDKADRWEAKAAGR